MTFDMTFPLPFGGITQVINFAGQPAKMMAFLMWVSKGCGKNHSHNIGVQFDGEQIWGTALLLDCYSKWSVRHENAVAFRP